MCEVSIIVPVYNTEKYLERCLTSIINQSFTNIEIIVLNDGSTDKSEEKILEFSKVDSRIKYYKHENMGLGPTRNRGINVAKGHYLSFIDSDDFIELDMIESLYNKIIENKADIACCEMYLYINETNKKIRKKLNDTTITLEKNNKEEFYRDFYFDRLYSHNACDKLYKVSLIRENNIKFGDNNRIFAEDNFFQIQLLQCANVITFVNRPLYNYYMRPGSLMNSYKENLVQRHLTMVNDLANSKMLEKDLPLMKKVLSILVFDALVAEAINIVQSNKQFSQFNKGIELLRRNDFYNNYIRQMIKEKASLLEPNRNRRYFIVLSSYMLKYGMNGILTFLFYCKYRTKS
ncbi:glycosyltransferase family 2 protein [Priestia endophytica]|uniref:Glycosyltransferase 2-like domain-containing protein n=1 Tax=Priestia endophytica TaxID=135735 RepID=A0AAX1QEY7_9BACI|nr:glycosyltransferase family 2 protein [Priestia endophytica]RAS82293.1 hypothetical protein A3864_01945 [Priestia endophytica]